MTTRCRCGQDLDERDRRPCGLVLGCWKCGAVYPAPPVMSVAESAALTVGLFDSQGFEVYYAGVRTPYTRVPATVDQFVDKGQPAWRYNNRLFCWPPAEREIVVRSVRVFSGEVWAAEWYLPALGRVHAGTIPAAPAWEPYLVIDRSVWQT